MDESNQEPSNSDLERMVDPSASEEELSRRIFREGLVDASQSIVHIACYGSSDSVKLAAAKYVVERNLGPIVTGKDGDKDKWDDLMEHILRDAGA